MHRPALIIFFVKNNIVNANIESADHEQVNCFGCGVTFQCRRTQTIPGAGNIQLILLT